MTDHEDDETAIPVRDEHTDSEGHVSDSGRHVNRNVVQRSSVGAGTGDREPSGLHNLRPRMIAKAAGPDAFDLVTPVVPRPRDVFEDEDASLSVDTPSGTPPGMRGTPRGPRIMPSDAGFTPQEFRRPGTERMAHAERAIGDEPDDAALPAQPERGRAGAIAPADLRPAPETGFIPPESRRPSTERPSAPDLMLDARRPTTVRGHVEPRRRPTTPPPMTGAAPREATVEADAAPPAAGSSRTAKATWPPTGSGTSVFERSLRDTQPGRPSATPPATRTSGSGLIALRDTQPGRPSAVAAQLRTGELAAEPSPYDSGIREARRPGTGRLSQPLAIPGSRAPTSPGAPGEPAQIPDGREPRRPSGGRPGLPDSTPSRASTEPSLADGDVRLPAPEHLPERAPSPALDRALRGVAIAAVLAIGAIGLGQPTSVFRGGLAWLVFLVFAWTGWGAIVARIARADALDAGQRAAIGAAGYVGVAGLLIAMGVLDRPVILGLIGIGFVGFAWHELTAPVATWQHVRAAARFARTNPTLAVFIAVVVVLACVRVLGAVSALDRNPWDDDVAYTPLVKRLLDTGDLVEPFSFRRLGAYGGQTALLALGAARGTLANVHLVDKGVAFVVVLLIVVGYARERRTQPLWLALIALVVVLLPETAINTASYWTGLACFLALYRVVVRAHWPLVGLIAAATCTLRQSFLVPISVFVLGVLIVRLVALSRSMPAAEAWHQERRNWAQVGAVGVAAIVPWWIAALAACHTFLFPVIPGTWNHELSLVPPVTTWPQELALMVTSCLETSPIAVFPLLAIVLVFTNDRRPGRPLSALAVATLIGFVALVHGFLGTDPFHLWRYAFGFATALAALLVLEVGGDDDSRIGLAPLARWVLLAALVLQIVVGRTALPKQAIAIFNDVREARAISRHGDPNARAEQRRYTAMQAAIPAGAAVVVMVDDPAMLDFGRNAIANLDTPGFASPGPQLPAFAGAEPLRAYLVAEGYRYAAFVRSERSRYSFRRPFWLNRMFWDAELFQIMSAYTIDAIDSLTELATTTQVLYDRDGLVVLDLAAPLREASRRTLVGDEPTRRAAWVRALADREGRHAHWALTTRADLRFEDGFAGVRYVDATSDASGEPAADTDAIAVPDARRGTPVLPMYRRAHLRVRNPGTTDMRLVLRAAIALDTVFTHPRLDVSLDGELLTSAVADAAGRYQIDVAVPRDRLAGGWHDLYLVFSSIAEPDNDVRELRIARLESIEWTPP